MTQRATTAATRASKTWAAETVKVRERERGSNAMYLGREQERRDARPCIEVKIDEKMS